MWGGWWGRGRQGIGNEIFKCYFYSLFTKINAFPTTSLGLCSSKKQWLTQNHKNLFTTLNLCQNHQTHFSSTSCASTCSFRGVSCTHTLPSGSRHLQASLSKWSLGQENAPKDQGGRWLPPFLPTEETWIHGGVTMPCLGHKNPYKTFRILSGEYSYPMAKG